MTSVIHTKRYFCLNDRLRDILFIIMLFAPFPVLAQSTRLISTKDGLPQSFVSGLEQDDSSFIWIATRNGLSRYDGIQYKLFQHDARDSSTLASNLIIWLRKDNQNHLWIEFENGAIDMMDPVTEKIRHYIHADQHAGDRISFIRRGWLVDHEGNFWGIVKAGGVSRRVRVSAYCYELICWINGMREMGGFDGDRSRPVRLAFSANCGEKLTIFA